MKKLINKPEDVVTEALEGMAVAHPDLLRVNFGPNYIVRADAPVQGKVALVSGGGSGHEPMHGGFVGMGMLDAACPGEVFTSPTPDQMLEATKAADGGAGVVHIVKNYTGDVMNFEMAADLARARGVEHARSNEPAMQRLMSRTATGDQRYLPLGLGLGSVDDPVPVVHPQLGVCRRHSAQGLG